MRTVYTRGVLARLLALRCRLLSQRWDEMVPTATEIWCTRWSQMRVRVVP